ncbi:MAG: sugar ABC transporter permease [Ideonella sp.]|nr:sugar ABC transporter permease [Ideonella sp.]
MKGPDARGALWLAAPLLVSATLLVLLPLLATLVLAFADYDALSPPRLSGWANLQRLWADPVFWKSLQNSALIAAISSPLRLLVALGLALLLMPQRRGVATVRALAYLPAVVPDIAYALLWLWLLNPIYGPLGLGLRALGLPADEWLLSPWGARLSIVLLGLFQVGELYVVLLAARRELPAELYELCAIEGVPPMWIFYRVTLPLLAPTLVFLAARDVAWSLQSSFVPALVITKGGPMQATLFLPLYAYQNGFEYFRFGYAAAISTAMFVLTAAMVWVQWLVLRRWQGAAA